MEQELLAARQRLTAALQVKDDRPSLREMVTRLESAVLALVREVKALRSGGATT